MEYISNKLNTIIGKKMSIIVFIDLEAYGHLKGPKIENEASKNNVLSSLRPMEKNLRRHEQVS